MFSDKFMNLRPSRLHYRHHSVDTDHQKQSGTSRIDYSEHEHNSLPTMVNFVTKSGGSFRTKTTKSVLSIKHSPPNVNKNSRRKDSTVLNQPLLQKRCSAQRKKLSLARVAKGNSKVSYDQPPPLYYSPIKSNDVFQSKPATEVITRRLQGLQFDVDTKMKSANPSVLSVSGKLKDCRRSFSVDIETCRNCGKRRSPFVMDSDLQFKLSGSRVEYLQRPPRKVS